MIKILSKKKYLELQDELLFLQDQVSELTEQLADQIQLTKSDYHVEQILQENLEWFDIDELNKKDRVIYSKNAESIMNNPVFKNEINFLITNTTKKAAIQAETSKGQQTLRDLQVIISTLADIRNRIDSLIIPEDTDDEEMDTYEKHIDM